MARRDKPVSIKIIEENGGRVVVRKYADGEVVRAPVVPSNKKPRKPIRPPLRLSRRTKD